MVKNCGWRQVLLWSHKEFLYQKLVMEKIVAQLKMELCWCCYIALDWRQDESLNHCLNKTWVQTEETMAINASYYLGKNQRWKKWECYIWPNSVNLIEFSQGNMAMFFQCTTIILQHLPEYSPQWLIVHTMPTVKYICHNFIYPIQPCPKSYLLCYLFFTHAFCPCCLSQMISKFNCDLILILLLSGFKQCWGLSNTH